MEISPFGTSKKLENIVDLLQLIFLVVKIFYFTIFELVIALITTYCSVHERCLLICKQDTDYPKTLIDICAHWI